MSDLRDRIRDEIAGWPVGGGYYSSTISVEEAAGLADAVIAIFKAPPSGAVGAAEQAVYERLVDVWPLTHWQEYESLATEVVQAALGAIGGGSDGR